MWLVNMRLVGLYPAWRRRMDGPVGSRNKDALDAAELGLHWTLLPLLGNGLCTMSL